jgi:hypothetical protein
MPAEWDRDNAYNDTEQELSLFFVFVFACIVLLLWAYSLRALLTISLYTAFRPIGLLYL